MMTNIRIKAKNERQKWKVIWNPRKNGWYNK